MNDNLDLYWDELENDIDLKIKKCYIRNVGCELDVINDEGEKPCQDMKLKLLRDF